jgi:hypothetical protein
MPLRRFSQFHHFARQSCAIVSIRDDDTMQASPSVSGVKVVRRGDIKSVVATSIEKAPRDAQTPQCACPRQSVVHPCNHRSKVEVDVKVYKVEKKEKGEELFGVRITPNNAQHNKTESVQKRS